MRKTETDCRPTGAQVLLFPARTPDIEGRRIYFLFSIRQVIEVLMQADVQPVPFSPPYVEGISDWCGRVLPVLSLERFLGMTVSETGMRVRPVVVRGLAQDSDGRLQELSAMVKLGAASRRLTLPVDCEPVAEPGRDMNVSHLAGVYRTQDSFLWVVDLDRVLNASHCEKADVS